MGTTFGIHKQGLIIPENEVSQLEEHDFISVGFRSDNGYHVWLNELAMFLPDDLRVYPIDNSAQGIYTIGDLRKLIGERGKNEIKKIQKQQIIDIMNSDEEDGLYNL